MIAGVVRRPRIDPWMAALAAALLGVGVALGLAGAASARLGMGLLGGGLAATGLLLALGAGWLDGLVLLAVALPLPPVYATDDLRLAAALAATGLVLVGWFVRWGPSGDRLRMGDLPGRATLALFASMVVAAAFARHTVPAARELVNVTALLALLVAATHHLAGRPRLIRRLALVLAGVVGVAGLGAALESVGIIPGQFPLAGSSLDRAAGGFGWPNAMATFLAIGLPFTVYAYRAAPGLLGRTVALAAITCAGVGLVGTFSRGNWLSVLVAPGALLLVREGRLVFRAWIAMVLLIVFVDLATGGAVSDRVAAAVTDPSAAQRLALMAAGVLMFLDSPIVGVGPGGFGEELETFGLLIPGLWDYVGSAHNAYIHMAAEAGLLGLAAFVAFLVGVLRVMIRRCRDSAEGPALDSALRGTLLWSFATACVVGLFEWTLAHGIGQLIILVAAMGVAARER